MTKDDTFSDKFRTGDETLTGLVSYRIVMPKALWFIAQVADTLLAMIIDINWEKGGDIEVDDAVESAVYVLESFGPMLGTIFPVVWADIPDGFLICNGDPYSREDYPSLYAILDPVFIVDADTFVVPDLRDRVAIGTGIDHSIGDTGGQSSVTLTTAKIPSHSHSDTGHGHSTHGHLAGLALAPGELPVTVPSIVPDVTGTASANITSAGGGEAHDNMQPFLTVKYVIWAR